MCSLLGFTREYFSYSDEDGTSEELFNARIYPYSRTWNQIVSRYLNEFKAKNGHDLRDEHGQIVKMGLDIS
jgi:hypothetical protein